ncbi:MAG TPA: hypothetical protein VD971_00170 [Phycisphaerales bacterium]|nr:hypothetical protein [Phycisphaerales bacterium]
MTPPRLSKAAWSAGIVIAAGTVALAAWFVRTHDATASALFVVALAVALFFATAPVAFSVITRARSRGPRSRGPNRVVVRDQNEPRSSEDGRVDA